MISEIVVTVPAADEQDEIAGCLAALERAIRQLQDHTALRARVVVALDACRDRTADVVAGFPEVTSVVCAARRVGTARRAAASAALAECADPEQLWLASTDADCRVPPDWLIEMANVAARGADLVLGTVRPAAGLPPGIEQAWHAAHQLGDGHAHIHGANLGIRAGTYLRLGGWRHLATHEDVDLVERAVRAAVPIARSGAAPVSASPRLIGRAPGGFAAYLQSLREASNAVSGELPAVS